MSEPIINGRTEAEWRAFREGYRLGAIAMNQYRRLELLSDTPIRDFFREVQLWIESPITDSNTQPPWS